MQALGMIETRGSVAAIEALDVEIGFLDRFTGSVVISGDVESVEVALHAVTETLKKVLGFTVTEVTRT